MAFGELRQAFWDEYLQFHPEEATTLGVTAGADRLRDHAKEALTAERRWYATMASRLDGVDPEALTLDERLDHEALSRLVRHHEHLWDHLWCAVDWSLYPFNMVMAQRVHKQADLVALTSRLAAIPAFLEQHERNVQQGMADGIRPDGALCSFFAEQQIPPASEFLRTGFADDPALGGAATNAADAYDAHVCWLRDEVLPGAAPARQIGEGEIRWRLEHTFGIEASPETLIRRARENLEETHEQLIACATRVDASVRDLTGVQALSARMQEKFIESDDAVMPTYRAYLDRALSFVREHALFNVPDDYAIGLEPLPPGFTATGHAGNWPAPLRDRSKLGHFMVSPRGQDHPTAWAADLTVHEGVPGHHLQSFCWQRTFSDHPAPVRFLLVHDQVAIPRHFWSPMLNIEGYAVYAEELMRRAGFFTAEEELFVLMAHCVRAVRVVADLSLHVGAMDEAEAARLLVESACLRESHAKMEVRRYLQIPLQASTYLLGRLAIDDLLEATRRREGDRFELAAFHDRFFSFATTDPTSIARYWQASPDRSKPTPA